MYCLAVHGHPHWCRTSQPWEGSRCEHTLLPSFCLRAFKQKIDLNTKMFVKNDIAGAIETWVRVPGRWHKLSCSGFLFVLIFSDNQPGVNYAFCTRAAPLAAGSSTAHPPLAADDLARTLTAPWPSVSPSALQPPLLWDLKWHVSRWWGGSGGCWWSLYQHTLFRVPCGALVQWFLDQCAPNSGGFVFTLRFAGQCFLIAGTPATKVGCAVGSAMLWTPQQDYRGHVSLLRGGMGWRCSCPHVSGVHVFMLRCWNITAAARQGRHGSTQRWELGRGELCCQPEAAWSADPREIWDLFCQCSSSAVLAGRNDTNVCKLLWLSAPGALLNSAIKSCVHLVPKTAFLRLLSHPSRMSIYRPHFPLPCTFCRFLHLCKWR